jgi:hypothetical protein
LKTLAGKWLTFISDPVKGVGKSHGDIVGKSIKIRKAFVELISNPGLRKMNRKTR